MTMPLNENDVRRATRKRRVYLLKLAVIVMLAFLIGIAAALPFYGARSILLWACQNKSMINRGFGDWLMGVEIGMALAVVGVGCVLISGLLVKKAVKAPYVPPVAEQIANLPAQEVLVRGASEPATLPEQLLRAAHATRDTGPDELLRAEGREL